MVSDLGHPAPKFEHEIEMIEVQHLGPPRPSGFAISFKQSAFGLLVDIVKRLIGKRAGWPRD